VSTFYLPCIPFLNCVLWESIFTDPRARPHGTVVTRFLNTKMSFGGHSSLPGPVVQTVLLKRCTLLVVKRLTLVCPPLNPRRYGGSVISTCRRSAFTSSVAFPSKTIADKTQRTTFLTNSYCNTLSQESEETVTLALPETLSLQLVTVS
jgi:hypothetical protein